MKNESPEQAAAHRAADAQRKRDERARKKETQAAAASQEELNAAKSFPEYWERNRANLTDAQRAEYDQRESDVLDLEFAMRKNIDGTYDDTTAPENVVPLEAIIEEVKEEVTTNGVTEAIILVIDRLWTDDEKSLREQILARGGVTAQLLKFGYRLALDGFLYERFYQKFLMPRFTIPQYFTTLTCSCGQQTSIPIEVARLYTAQLYRCGRCRELEQKSRAQANIGAAQHDPANHEVFDAWGRVKDND